MASIRSSFLSPTTLCLLLVLVLLSAKPSSADDVMLSGDSLLAGQSLTYGSYQFIMRTNCNLVLFDGPTKLWETGTAGRGVGCHAKLERTGELAIYNIFGFKIWSSGSAGKLGNYVLVLQRNGNVAIYGGLIAATGTGGQINT